MSDDHWVGSLLVVTGPPGAGKSTLAGFLSDHLIHSVLVEGDRFFGFLRTGAVDSWLPDAHAQNTVVTEAAGSAVGRYVDGGYETVYDGIIGPWFLSTFAAATGLDHLDYVVLLPSVERCVQHVDRRTGHSFADEAATRHMHDQFARAAIASRHLLVDPPADVEATGQAVLGLRAALTLRYTIA